MSLLGVFDCLPNWSAGGTGVDGDILFSLLENGNYSVSSKPFYNTGFHPHGHLGESKFSLTIILT